MSSQVEPAKGSVKFLQFHQPALAAGDYEIAVSQSVKITDHADIKSFTADRFFTVAGERFDLKPTDVHAVFPPDGNLGEHSNVLPHIILNRSTLPWERLAERYAEGEREQKTGVPWLALLLFDEDQKPMPQTVKASDLVNPPAGAKFPKLTLESAQHENDPLTVIDVPQRVLKKIMPTIDDLKLLAHVRFGTDAKDQPTGDELAVIIANRIPQAGKTSTAHLVSVEGRFAKGADGEPQKYGFDYNRAADNDLIRLVTLKSWSFACEDHKKSFTQLLLDLNKSSSGPAALRLPRGNAQNAEKLLAKGYVLLPHSFRQGDHTASWFHGPLIPGKNTSPEMDLPARSSDELVRYDPDLAMFDVSYAAAWELGRLLALQDKAFSTSLFQWKREHAQQLAQHEQRLTHLPFQKETPADVPTAVADWFKGLRKFEGVPFNYLVPDERMLPPETIRFFRVDHEWVDCLTDGAFSIGRVVSSDQKTEKTLAEKCPELCEEETVTGFLLRSEVVSGWPGLIVDAFSDHKREKPLSSLRIERLEAGVLICLFAGEIARVEIHQKPETLHFGFDADGKGGFKKGLRDSKGADLPDKNEPAQWRQDSPRTLDVAAFANSMKKTLPLTSPLTSAQFGLQMVEGVKKIIFLSK
jgi:hypothetical protein